MSEEIVVEKTHGKYRLPDRAIDLEEWLRDGLEVYNLFVYMKPIFFQMLESMPDMQFTGSMRKANEDKLKFRLTIVPEAINKYEGEYDELVHVRLEKYE